MASYYVKLPGSGSKSWKAAVTNAAALPTIGNNDGDTRVTLNDQSIYVWKAATSSWIQAATPAATSAITALNTDVSATGPGAVVATIQPNVVTNAKLAQAPASTIKGNVTAGIANPQDLTGAQTLTILGGGAQTSGSVYFANASGLLGQDNANFFWDATNKRLGLGTNAPGSGMHILNSVAINKGLIIQGAAAQSGNLQEWQSSTSVILASVSSAGNGTFNSVGIGLGGGSMAQNTAVGAGVMAATATGNYNSAFGYSALNAVTSGQYNTAIGRLALYSLTIGNNNVSIGAGSMQNYNGSFGVAIGTSAMSFATGSNSVAIGMNALYSNAGDYNMAIGDSALSNNTTGIRNLALGANTLVANTTGQFNVAVGELALYSSNSSSNTAIGRQAGQNITSGGSNMCMGFQAGLGITTGSNNTIIGSATGLAPGLSNNIILADGAGNQRLNIDNLGNVGIGVSAPGARLDVLGKAQIDLNGNIKTVVPGAGFYVKEGLNACMGVATLAAGTVTVATTKVTASSRIFLTIQNLGTVTIPQAIGVTARVVGTSFTITSAGATDTSVIAWEIKEPS